ncbi:hypothetical protein DM860_009193 [Cuscuta australis]|uniref:Uncharacterized protein n=1 Tax=Cuscuta australis TaxID=267555 RepID=A0A328DB92_9ASTE|nr:hypothetical protein DM860_009193 [Cuscuta australis]
MEPINSLATPLDNALAFNNPSHGGFLTALWAWAAVLTAAVGLWRIKSSAMSAQSDPRPEFQNGSSDHPAPPRDIALSSPPPAESSWVSAPDSTAGEAATGVRKGEKFTAYFDGDDAVDGNAGGVDDIYKNRNGGDGEGGGIGLVDEWYRIWEGAIETRNGGAGWYRNQDLTVINGNVVRLWDRSRRRRWA